MVSILIRTEILEMDPQSGMKSEQRIDIDFGAQTVVSSFVTGTTTIPLIGIKLDSVRDSFVLTNTSFEGESAQFHATGQTATGVRILPNIDYDLQFVVNKDGSGEVSGSHDGYPAYFIRISERTVYSYRHNRMELWKLGGKLDVQFGPVQF